MAFEGPLRELALTDVIQLLYLSRKTGTLSITGEGAPRPGLIHFDEGFVVGARSAGEISPLGRLLVMAGKATMRQVEAALEAQRREPGRRIGTLLAETQGIPVRDIQRQLRFQVEEAVFELVRWRDGHFRFEETERPQNGGIPVRIPSEALLMESMRRADEWTEMASGDPDASLVPALVDSAAGAAGVLDLQPREWQVLAAIDGSRTLREIAREIGRAEFDVAKAVYSLASGGVVELKTRPSAPRPGARRDPSSAAVDGVEAELRAERIGEALRRAEGLRESHPASGVARLLYGRALVASGEIERGVAALKEAVQLDPLLAAGYFHLGMAAARLGDFGRGRENLTTFSRLPDAPPRDVEIAMRAVQLMTELSALLEEIR
ncbi:MAG TPA: DUF4388 domain-containing protein [Longimicrobiaceae bacterium]